MTDIKVEKVADDSRTLPVFKELESLADRIRARAFEMFSGRGFGGGHALDDWLAAEREICWPAGELVEQGKQYVLSVALPGFDAADISVTATPREVIVHANSKTERKAEEEARKGESVCWSQFRSNDVYRRVELAREIDVQSVTASLTNGMLKVLAAKAEAKAKAEKPARLVPLSTAA